MDICLIQVPYHAGDERHPSSAGPRRLVEAGAADVLRGQGHPVRVVSADRAGPFRDTVSSSAVVNKQVASRVRDALTAGQVPIALAGSCVTCQGVLAGFDHARCGAVWIDAHADFNTPETSVSGFFPGMSLAVVTGQCYGAYWAQIGDSAPLAEEAVAMFGVRAVSPHAERQRLDRSAMQVVEWRDGKPRGDAISVLDTLARRVREIYLHVDLDGFDPEVSPGIADEPVPGGLSLEDADRIIRAAADRFRIRAATLATFSPELDREDKTLRLALQLIQIIGECTSTIEEAGAGP